VTAGRRVRLGAAVLASAALALALVARATCPPLLEPGRFGRQVLDRDGRLLRLTLAPDQAYRLPTPLAEVSPHLQETTLLYEDRWFYLHPGFNPVALLKAALQTYGGGGARRGGSTLTMQLARLRYGLDTRSPPGKLVQVARAVQLELAYSKAELLEAFFTLAPYGGNVEGAGAAAQVYFHKQASALSLPEAMALAVLPQRPAHRQPMGPLESADLMRARLALAAQYRTAHPGVSADALALEAPLSLFTARQLPFLAPHAVQAALALKPSGTLTTTLDGPLQAQLERQVAGYLARHQDLGLHNAVVLVADVATAEVLAHVGSARFFDATIDGQVDGAAAPRSPGSALKPWVYARALDEGLIHPRTLLDDLPTRFGSYNPENFDSQYLGPLPAAEALVKSRNVPAVQLNLRLVRGLYEVLAAVGVRGLQSRATYGAGIVLGGVDVSPNEVAQLYLALAHGGTWRRLKRLRDEAPAREVPLVSPEAAELTLRMLAAQEGAVERWTSPRDAVTAAWKTGTSFAYRDAWTAGVVGRFAVVVWLGNFDGQPNPALVGRTAAAPLFFEVVDGLRPRLQGPGGQRPAVAAHLEEAEVCAVSGKRPGPHCPHRVRTQVIPGVSPIDACTVHRVLHLEVATGRRRCEAVPGVTRDEVREVWPSDVMRQFERAGLARQPLPEAAEPCPGDAPQGAQGPRIRSPQPGLVYALRRSKPAEGRLQLIADADGAARRVTWFDGAEVVGVVAPGAVLEWAAPSGRHEVRAVDDRGEVDRVSFEVRWVD
jgi:penicillin-binding protein 1C